jgi:hypothetical protein
MGKLSTLSVVSKIHSMGAQPAGGAISVARTTHNAWEVAGTSAERRRGALTTTALAATSNTASRSGWPGLRGTWTRSCPKTGAWRAASNTVRGPPSTPASTSTRRG